MVHGHIVAHDPCVSMGEHGSSMSDIVGQNPIRDSSCIDNTTPRQRASNHRCRLRRVHLAPAVCTAQRPKSVPLSPFPAARRAAQLATIAERLERLRAESHELLEWQRLDRERRAIEYRILGDERTDIRERLKTVRATAAHLLGSFFVSGDERPGTRVGDEPLPA